jgi:hypothetical protein
LVGREPPRWRRVVLKKADQGIEMGGEKILAPEVGDDSLLDLVADAKGFDQPEVLVLAVGGLDRAEEHAVPI